MVIKSRVRSDRAIKPCWHSEEDSCIYEEVRRNRLFTLKDSKRMMDSIVVLKNRKIRYNSCRKIGAGFQKFPAGWIVRGWNKQM
jgi:hypothetical protein